MSYNISLSSNMHSSAFSPSRWKLRTTLYGSTIVPDTLGDGMIENVFVMRSRYPSRIFKI